MELWRKSSYSHANGGNCVEVAESWRKSSYSTGGSANCLEINWQKSSYSHANGGDCVEVAECSHSVKVRDSQHPHLGHLTASAREWSAFLTAVRTSELG
jgi:hypothetical protein